MAVASTFSVNAALVRRSKKSPDLAGLRALTPRAFASGCIHDPADDDAVGEHVIVVVVPLAGGAGSRRALEDQIIFSIDRAGCCLAGSVPAGTKSNTTASGSAVFKLTARVRPPQPGRLACCRASWHRP
jgi:hypothetical protein